ncbi:retron system putative HNH endonuclease [Psychrobacter arenosus]|uniref:retron system putative HNH endonuclease n=1 Tax=Psychrobacter arenosus TaxID=256326 RepID=UPI0019186579|nr:retron system putative HNH endonuclease [Psychrobacter arenosus]
MQRIDKSGKMPEQTRKAFLKYKSKKWGDIPYETTVPLREQLLAEQHELCCYCCQSIKDKTTHLEHLYSRKDYPNRRFDYENLLLSCDTPKQCDNAKGNQELPLHPLMNECDEEIKLNLAGELVSYTERAAQAIEILNLNNRKINYQRKGLIDAVSFTFDPTQAYGSPIGIQDLQTLTLIIEYMKEDPRYQELKYILNKLT